MARAPPCNPGWRVGSLTRSPSSQTSRSCSRNPARYCLPVRAGITPPVDRGAKRKSTPSPAERPALRAPSAAASCKYKRKTGGGPFAACPSVAADRRPPRPTMAGGRSWRTSTTPLRLFSGGPERPSSSRPRRASRGRGNGKDMRRIGDVLQPLLAEIDELGGDPSPHLAPGIGGDADAAGRCEALEPRRDIDAVTIDVVRRHDDVAEIDADAQLDAVVRRQPGVAPG